MSQESKGLGPGDLRRTTTGRSPIPRPLQSTPFLGPTGWLALALFYPPPQNESCPSHEAKVGHQPWQQWRAEWPAGRASQDVVPEACLKHRRHGEGEGTGSLSG